MDIAAQAESILAAKNGLAKEQLAYKVAKQSLEQQEAVLSIVSDGTAAAAGSSGADSARAASAALDGKLGQLMDTVA